MDSLNLFPSLRDSTLFGDLSSPLQPSSFTFLDKKWLESLEFLDSLEDSLTKDTNTPNELSRLEEPSIPNLELLDKKIRKWTRKQKDEQVQDGIPCIAKGRDKRNIKKPMVRYENLQQEELKKTRRPRKKPTVKEPITKPEQANLLQGSTNMNRPEDSYRWRDWCLYFNEGIMSLTQEEFLTFLRLIHENHPECISFEKGYAELKVVLSNSMKTMVQESPKLSYIVEQNIIYQVFSEYVDRVKSLRIENHTS